MAITLVASGAVTANAGSGNITSVPVPTGHATGDLLVLVITAADNVVCTVPAGWTKKLETNGTSYLRQTIAYKIATSAAETAPTVTHAAGDSAMARIHGFRGTPASGDPFDVATANVVNTLSSTFTSADVTPLSANSAVLFVGSSAVSGSSGDTPTTAGYSGTNPTFTELQDSETGLGLNLAYQVTAWGLKTDTTATGVRTATMTGPHTGGQPTITTMLVIPQLGAVAGRAVRSRAARQAVNRSAVF